MDDLNLASFVLGPTADRHADITAIPNDCGVYAMFTADGDLLYIGRAVMMGERLRQHRRRSMFHTGEPAAYSCKAVPPEIVRHVDVAHIRALLPPENMRMEPAYWGHHEAMVAVIRREWGLS